MPFKSWVLQHALGLKAQGTLPRALREKRIRRVGALQETPIYCRMLAAAKPNLLELVERGEFLPDLYYRLNFLAVEVPPLREHREDIPLLVEHFRKKVVAETGAEKTFRPQVLKTFESYAWPGNVAELEGCVSRLLTDASGQFIESSQLDGRFGNAMETINEVLTLMELDARYERERKKLIEDALRTTRSRRGAATRLGINESTLRSITAKADSIKKIFGALK
ncbi:MAG: sigma-54-dependent Fis family transcriptional regulator [Cryobacterium sp.]|nr:sigma-54-dependent Fis family transcriptional regulator [Oligoflexia bacterium]